MLEDHSIGDKERAYVTKAASLTTRTAPMWVEAEVAAAALALAFVEPEDAEPFESDLPPFPFEFSDTGRVASATFG